VNPITATLILFAAAITFAALWRWLYSDYRRYHRENERPEPEPVEGFDYASALRCTGGRLTPPAPSTSTPLLDAFRERH